MHLKEEGFKYLFDTVVVIAGILIAFSLDNWWEINRRTLLSRSYAASLKSDLEEDIRMVRQIMWQMEESIDRIDSLAIINHSVSEFVVDFISMMPGVPKAKGKSW